jgi:hypothetical protein
MRSRPGCSACKDSVPVSPPIGGVSRYYSPGSLCSTAMIMVMAVRGAAATWMIRCCDTTRSAGGRCGHGRGWPLAGQPARATAGAAGPGVLPGPDRAWRHSPMWVRCWPSPVTAGRAGSWRRPPGTGRAQAPKACGKGCKGHRDYAWAWLATASPAHWLLVRRSCSGSSPLAYFWCPAPPVARQPHRTTFG